MSHLSSNKLNYVMQTGLHENLVSGRRVAGGFSLIELMIAITLGILLSIGLVTLFGATSKTNRVQDAMAQLQENGRYAITRLNNDLRMVGHQTLNVSGFVSSDFSAATTPNGVVNPTIAADVYVTTIKFPDFSAAGLSAPTGWPANTPWPLSQRYFLQGYECSTPPCSPAIPTGTAHDFPTAGVALGNRVASADVLTLRYMNAPGWSLTKNELTETTTSGSGTCAGDSLKSLTLTPATGSPASNFVSGDLVMLVVGSRAEIFEVAVSGTSPSATLTPQNLIAGTSIPCFAVSPAGTDAVLYNFSQDFLTVSYYLKLDADPTVAGRLIPILVRRQNTIDNFAAAAPVASDQELVQGIEQMDFLYGLEQMNGAAAPDSAVSYLTADEVTAQSSFTNCPPPPEQYVKNLAGSAEPDCLWRSAKSVEAHLLVDSINNMYDLTSADMSYQYGYGYNGNDNKQQVPVAPPAPTAALVSGLTAGAMLRREFVSLIAIRNYNP